MPKFEITVSEREQEWSKDNEPLQSQQQSIVAQSNDDTPGYGKSQVVQSGQIDTPGYGRGAGPLSPLSD